jgi:hypothetical protein
MGFMNAAFGLRADFFAVDFLAISSPSRICRLWCPRSGLTPRSISVPEA